MKLLVERLVSYGITLTRTSNCWNDFRGFKKRSRSAPHRMETVVNLIYRVSPRHTDEYYAQKATEAASIAPIAFVSKMSAVC